MPFGDRPTVLSQKKSPKSFFPEEGCLSLNIFSIDLIGPKEMMLLLAQKLSKNLLDPLKNVLYGMSYSIVWEKMGLQFFSLGEWAFFQRNCYFNDLLGATKKILELAPFLPKYLIEPDNLLLDGCHSQ